MVKVIYSQNATILGLLVSHEHSQSASKVEPPPVRKPGYGPAECYNLQATSHSYEARQNSTRRNFVLPE